MLFVSSSSYEKIRYTYFGPKAFRGCWRLFIYNILMPYLQHCVDYFPCYLGCNETCRTEEVKVYCKCQLQDEGDMIQCQEWFHTTCEVIRDFAWMKNCFFLCFFVDVF